MGLGTCPIGLITAFEDEIKEELNIPEEKKVVIGVAVGFRDQRPPLINLGHTGSRFVTW